MSAFLRTFTSFLPKHVRKGAPLNSNNFWIASRNMASTFSALPNVDSKPVAGQIITHNEREYTTVKEGLAYILVPISAQKVPQTSPKGDTQAQSVFYNPIQQFNRDLSVLAIKAYGEEVLERKLTASRKSKASKRAKKRKGTENVSPPEQNGKKIKLGEGDIGLEQNGHEIERDIQDAPSESEAQIIEVLSAEEEVAVQSVEAASKPAVTNDDTTEAASNVKDDILHRTNGINASISQGGTAPKASSFTILDALSATGLRALRYAQEIPFATSITANDLLATATRSIALNVKHNKLDHKITPITGNALAHMYSLAVDDVDSRGRVVPQKKYDVIDLDPYGTAAPFIDAAVQSVADGGLLCVTCTDAGVWASNGYPEKAFSLYGGTTIKGNHNHEGGLRLILQSIAASAGRYGLAIEPLLSLSIDFYARVFVRVKKSPAEVKYLAGKTMVVYNCDAGCGAWKTQLLARNKVVENKKGSGTFHKHVYAQGPSTDGHCEHCGFKMHMAGPMYAGPLHTPAFVKRILDMLPTVSKDTYQTTARIEGMLSMALEETIPPPPEPQGLKSPTAVEDGQIDPATVDEYPFFFIPSVVSKVIHCVTPHEDALRGALRHLGYRVTRSHTKPGSIKTDAPWSVIWEVMREWVKQKSPIKEGAIRPGTAGWKIMGCDEKKDSDGTAEAGGEPLPPPEERKVVFDEALGKEKDKKKLVRYQINPRENWGPMNRASGR